MQARLLYLLMALVPVLLKSQDSSVWKSVSVHAKNAVSRQFSGYYDLKVDGNTIHAVGNRLGNKALCYFYSRDAGQTWYMEVIDDSTNYPMAKYTFPFDVEVTNPKTGKKTKGRIDSRFATFGDKRGALCIDKKGRPHVCYLVGYNNVTRASWVKYAVRSENGKWNIQTADAITGDSTATAIMGETSMSLDSDDQPHLVFSIYKTGTVYCHLSGNSWKKKGIPNTVFNWPGNCIKIDSKNNPHIVVGRLQNSGNIGSATVSTAMEYFYSDDEGENWQRYMVDTDCWFECDLALDSKDAPLLAYRSLQRGVLFAEKRNGKWKTKILSAFVQGGRPLVQVDNCSRAHVFSYQSYNAASTNLFHFYEGADGNFFTETVTADAYNCSSAGIPGLDIANNTIYLLTEMSAKTERVFTFKLKDNCGEKEKKKEETQGEIAGAKIETGKSFVLNNIFFEPNKADLLPASYEELKKLLQIMKDFPKLKIEVRGHTSKNNEGEKFNEELSTNRAMAVKIYLTENGIKTERIKAKGFGFSQPLYDEIKHEELIKNRRVEVFILSEE